ncbi:MAG: RdgB/HAM1 family non-canonical purine NTP pyrophosphatase [Pseudomonadota bacterium]
MRKFDLSTLLVATHNKGKLEEIEHLLKPYNLDVVGAASLGLEEPLETEDTFVGNARIKAHAAAKAANMPAMSDDSGLEIAALNGAPGVYTADWAETETGRNFEMAMAKAYQMLLDSGAETPWKARFCCTLVIAWPDGDDVTFEGTVDGQIIWPMRGEQGHGYDPIFLPDGYDETFGEMDRWEKNKISHRARALSKLIEQCFD